MKFFDLFNAEKQRRKSEDNYLNSSVNIIDLENRLREIDRGKFSKHNTVVHWR